MTLRRAQPGPDAGAGDFAGFRCLDVDPVLRISCPSPAGFDIQTLAFEGASRAARLASAADFFSRRYAYPAPAVPASLPVAAKPPAISCIIVVHGNGPFVEERAIPALLVNCPGRAIELILVRSGVEASPVEFPGATVVRCRGDSVAAAYNAGAAAAGAPELAFFHDDCIIDDPRWLDRVEAARGRGAEAVSPEIRQLRRVGDVAIAALPVAKAVPLVVSRRVFETLGGFDDSLDMGYEDLEFTLRLLDAGYRVARLRFGYRHFGGMSSCLRFLYRQRLEWLFAALAVPAEVVLAEFAGFMADPQQPASRSLAARGAVGLHRVLSRHAGRIRAEMPAAEVLARLRSRAERIAGESWSRLETAGFVPTPEPAAGSGSR